MSEKKLEICSQLCRARCCKGPSPTITVFDIVRILKYLNACPKNITKYFEVYSHREYTEVVLPSQTGISLSNSTMQTLRERLGDLYESLLIVKLRKSSEKTCIFLTDDNKCSIYPVRPLGCRAYPVKITGIDNECLLVKHGIDLSEEFRYLKKYLEELVIHYRLIVKYYVNSLEKLAKLVELMWNITSTV